ncbi:M23 family metallopeptidase [Mycolicibacterium frederiksbergense]|uniref:M23 family metallopeptidase n=1 Tax=Mycolicibacterium frederiksbergense TaxID=117567 RepID=A0A6H0SCE7_9MYCO|nr:M23 family metallopeptidase [Mycolicibacterium frederiksbergense]
MATPLLARALAAPVPVPATDGRTHLVYELLLTNSMNQDVTVDSVVVRPGDGDPLLTLAGAELADRTRVLGTTAPTAALGPAQSALVWLDVTTENGRTPTELDHEVKVTLTQPMPPLLPAEVTETVAPVTVQTRQPVRIAAPLRGPQWWDANGCCGMTAHRMAINPIDGELWGAERFAIDYVQLMPDGRLFDGKVDDLSGYPYFGADIHAVADGPVVAVLDGLPEQAAGVNPTGLRLDEYGGNHVVQDIGGGNYAFYAHLKTGSVAVKPGDRLSAGQVLGQLGNSGNTDAPHLHFHVMDGPDPLKADGLPFVIDAFRLTARISDEVGPDGDAIDAAMAGKPAPLQPDVSPRDETGLLPLVSDVMDYADE